MAFVISVQTSEGSPAYWAGGDVCSEYGADAARFMSETDADATIDVLKRAIGLSETAMSVDLGEVL